MERQNVRTIGLLLFLLLGVRGVKPATSPSAFHALLPGTFRVRELRSRWLSQQLRRRSQYTARGGAEELCMMAGETEAEKQGGGSRCKLWHGDSDEDIAAAAEALRLRRSCHVVELTTSAGWGGQLHFLLRLSTVLEPSRLITLLS